MARFSILLTTLLLGAACTAEVDTATNADRGPIGKADAAAGSCGDAEGVNSCGGQSDGACWCDDYCDAYGDCCDDKGTVCDGEPEPEPEPDGCGPEDDSYVEVASDVFFVDPQAFVGQRVVLTGTAFAGFPVCTKQACFQGNPCCNSCGAGIEMVTPDGRLSMQGIGCGGDNCSVLSNCDVPNGQTFTAWGTVTNDFQLALDVDGTCAEDVAPEVPCEQLDMSDPDQVQECTDRDDCFQFIDPACPVCLGGDLVCVTKFLG